MQSRKATENGAATESKYSKMGAKAAKLTMVYMKESNVGDQLMKKLTLICAKCASDGSLSTRKSMEIWA